MAWPSSKARRKTRTHFSRRTHGPSRGVLSAHSLVPSRFIPGGDPQPVGPIECSEPVRQASQLYGPDWIHQPLVHHKLLGFLFPAQVVEVLWSAASVAGGRRAGTSRRGQTGDDSMAATATTCSGAGSATTSCSAAGATITCRAAPAATCSSAAWDRTPFSATTATTS